MKKITLKPKIRHLVKRRKWIQLRDLVIKRHPSEIADLLMIINEESRAEFFRLLPRKLAAETFSYLRADYRDELLLELGDEEMRYIMAKMKPDDRTALLEDLSEPVVKKLLGLLETEDLKEACMLLNYPEESVGRLMTPDVIAVNLEWTVARSLAHIRRAAYDSETVNVIYAADSSWKLVGALDIKKLLLADPAEKIQNIMDKDPVNIFVLDNREKAASIMQKYDLYALPVVDSGGVLLGIVTIDDALDVVEEEATEDFEKTSAITPLKEGYAQASVWSLFKKRINWLVILVLVNLVSSGIIATYEEMLEAAIALAFFIPLLIDSGGNAGAQSATLMIRALATGNVKMNQWFKYFSKEIMVGLLLGLAMGAASFGLGALRGDMTIGLVVGLSMVAIIITANLIGILLPFILTKLKFDPAVASSPLITSVADAAGLLIYFTIATRLIGIV